MNRRIVLKQLALATAGAAMLPMCVSDPKKVTIALTKLQINGDEEELLALLADALIPTTDTPGARAVGAHHFALVMVDDCLEPAEQESYLKGMRAFNAACKEIGGKSFSKATEEERLLLLSEFEKKKEELNEDVQAFYRTSKRFIIDGYRTSEHFLTNVKPYKLVPGPVFLGCVSIDPPKS